MEDYLISIVVMASVLVVAAAWVVHAVASWERDPMALENIRRKRMEKYAVARALSNATADTTNLIAFSLARDTVDARAAFSKKDKAGKASASSVAFVPTALKQKAAVLQEQPDVFDEAPDTSGFITTNPSRRMFFPKHGLNILGTVSAASMDTATDVGPPQLPAARRPVPAPQNPLLSTPAPGDNDSGDGRQQFFTRSIAPGDIQSGGWGPSPSPAPALAAPADPLSSTNFYQPKPPSLDQQVLAGENRVFPSAWLPAKERAGDHELSALGQVLRPTRPDRALFDQL